MWQQLTSVEQVTAEPLLALFHRARELKQGALSKALRDKIVVTLFYEPSTRTRLSFEAAALRLGGGYISTENAREFSSAVKGETLEDTIRVCSFYGDCIVLRHHEDGGADRAAAATALPLINAGDGGNEHPTQALLDLFTIWEACREGRLPSRNLRLHFYGDNLKGRTVRSLALLLGKHAYTLGLRVESLHFGGPYRECAQPDAAFYERLLPLYSQLHIANSGLGTSTNVLYLTRVQRERYKERHLHLAEPRGPEALHWARTFGPQHASVMSGSSIIMHPLPRAGDLATRVDDDSRAWYFEQAKNGLYVRMALLEMMLN